MKRFQIAIVCVVAAMGCKPVRAAPSTPTCTAPDFSGVADTGTPPDWDEATVPKPPNKHAGIVVFAINGDFDAYEADPDNKAVPWLAHVKHDDFVKFIDIAQGEAQQVGVVRPGPPPPPIQERGRAAVRVQWGTAQGLQAEGL